MRKLLLTSFAAVLAGSAFSQVLYNNGAVTDVPGGGFGGADLSQLIAPNTIIGFGAQISANNAVADDFTVGGPGWRVTRICVYGYQTNAVAYPFNAVNFQIAANHAAAIAWTAGAANNGGSVGYRAVSTTPLVTSRQIWKIDIPVNILLAPGAYVLRWQVGVAAGLSFMPPVVPTNGGGNAAQSIAGGAFVSPLLDTGSQRGVEMPFVLKGEILPEPGSMLALGAGVAALLARRRRK